MAILNVREIPPDFEAIGPVAVSIPGGAAAGSVLLATPSVARAALAEHFAAEPDSCPPDYDAASPDTHLVFQELKLEEDPPTAGRGRLTVMFGYRPRQPRSSKGKR